MADTAADINYMEQINTEIDYDLSSISTSGLTRRATYASLGTQMESIIKVMIENQPYAVAAYKEVINYFIEVFNTLKFNDTIAENIRSRIHLMNSGVSDIQNHSDEIINDELLFGYLYSLLDTLRDYEEWGYADEETDSSGDDH